MSVKTSVVIGGRRVAQYVDALMRLEVTSFKLRDVVEPKRFTLEQLKDASAEVRRLGDGEVQLRDAASGFPVVRRWAHAAPVIAVGFEPSSKEGVKGIYLKSQ